MDYYIHVTWNAAVVLSGECTATVAHDLTRHFLVDQFAGKTSRDAEGQLPSLDRVLAMVPGQKFDMTVRDETGRTRVVVSYPVSKGSKI